jgi:hypothetical protein
MECEVCYKKFECGLDYNSHNLFIHNIITNEVNIISNTIKLRLKSKYVKACNRLHILAQESNKLGEKYYNSNRDLIIWNEYQTASNKYQKQCYEINRIVYEIESYGLCEDDFNV